MIYIVSSVVFFLITVSVHREVFFLVRNNPKSVVRSMIVFPVGLFIFAFISFVVIPRLQFNNPWWIMPLPFTGVILYLIFSFLFVIYFNGIYLGEASPTIALLLLLQKRHVLREKEIFEAFSDESFIGSRLQNLTDSGMVNKKRNRFYATLQGQRIVSFVDFYRNLLGWHEGG